jgi:hypothetical protein
MILADRGDSTASLESQAAGGFPNGVLNPSSLLSEIHRLVPESAIKLFAAFEIVWTAAVALSYASRWLRIWIASRTWRRVIVGDAEVYVSDEYGWSLRATIRAPTRIGRGPLRDPMLAPWQQPTKANQFLRAGAHALRARDLNSS